MKLRMLLLMIPCFICSLEKTKAELEADVLYFDVLGICDYIDYRIGLADKYMYKGQYKESVYIYNSIAGITEDLLKTSKQMRSEIHYLQFRGRVGKEVAEYLYQGGKSLEERLFDVYKEFFPLDTNANQ